MSVPADHKLTAETVGKTGILKIMLNALWNYRNTSWYLLKKDRRAWFNFLYTKTMVPTGEGSGELAYYLIGNYLCKHPEKVQFPKYIEIEMTSRCNKRCIICEHTFWKEPSRDLTFEQFKNLVDQFNLRWVNLTGEGDAFLNPDYLKMIHYLKQKGVSVYLVDSMDLVTPKISRELVQLGVDGLYISMDGATKETYEKIKEGCSFNKVKTNIQDLLLNKKVYSSPIPEICFRYIVNKLNVHEMADFVSFIRSIGTRKQFGDGSKIHFAGLLDYPEIHDLYLPTIPEAEINKTIRRQKAHKDNLPVVFAHTEPEKHPSINSCLAWMEPYFSLIPHPMSLPCCAVLMSNNRKFLSKYCFSNYTKEPFRKTWEHPYYTWFRKTMTNPNAPVPALCRSCRAYNTQLREKSYGVDWRVRGDFE